MKFYLRNFESKSNNLLYFFMETKKKYCVILAGGKGKRLWPCSREEYPKQFIDFFGSGRTLLQQTFDRMKKVVPEENIFVSTNEGYLALVREQLPDVAADRILAEPIHRNTAPSVAWAAHRIARYCSDAALLVTPSDQMIQDEERFGHDIDEGFAFVAQKAGLLTLGIRPTRPEPGYGYIQLGDPDVHGVYRVKSFTEKPEREFAKMFVKSGEFYWNTGMFMATIDFLSQCLDRVLPDVLRNFDALKRDWTIAEEQQFMEKNFPLYPNLSVDYGVLEKSEHVYVMKCGFGWADVGTWHSIYEAMRRSETDNVIIDCDVMTDNSFGNVIKLPKGRLAIVNGLEGYIVAEHNNVLLICKKEDSSALVRKYVNEVQMKRGPEFV